MWNICRDCGFATMTRTSCDPSARAEITMGTMTEDLPSPILSCITAFRSSRGFLLRCSVGLGTQAIARFSVSLWCRVREDIGKMDLHHFFCDICLDLADCNVAFDFQEQRLGILRGVPVDVAFVLQLADKILLIIETFQKALRPLHLSHSQAVYNNPGLPSCWQ